MQKAFKTYKEFNREYFPNSILERLDDELCSRLNIDKENSHIIESKDSRMLGSIKLKKKPYQILGESSIADIVEEFYNEEGFATNCKSIGYLNVSNKKEKYAIFITELNNECSLYIH